MHCDVIPGFATGSLSSDTRLDHQTLPEDFEQDSDRLARFEREAKLLASLNHPNIAAIYELGKFEGRHFLVLELVEGETPRRSHRSRADACELVRPSRYGAKPAP